MTGTLVCVAFDVFLSFKTANKKQRWYALKCKVPMQYNRLCPLKVRIRAGLLAVYLSLPSGSLRGAGMVLACAFHSGVADWNLWSSASISVSTHIWPPDGSSRHGPGGCRHAFGIAHLLDFSELSSRDGCIPLSVPFRMHRHKFAYSVRVHATAPACHARCGQEAYMRLLRASGASGCQINIQVCRCGLRRSL